MQSSTNIDQPHAMHTNDERGLNGGSSHTGSSTDNEIAQGKEHPPNKSRNSTDTKKSERRFGLFRDKVGESSKAVTRALSLSLFIHAFRALRHPTGKGLHEPIKVAIRQSRLIALLRSLVHLVPFTFALFEIILNWNVYYVGSKAYNPAVYQVVAKAHEVLVHSSIASIVFSVVRRDLALGKGLPFGLLFGGLQVSQISYLWSVELWGAMKSEFLQPSRKLGLFTLLTGSILLAVTSGPASAVLLIPRLQLWPAGSTRIWVNATANQLWPLQIDGSSIPQTCSRVGIDVPNACPSSEWYAVRYYLFTWKQTLPTAYVDRYSIAESQDYCLLHGKSSTRLLKQLQILDFIGKGPIPFISTTQQAVVADALANTGALWFLSLTNVTANAGHGNALSDQSDATHAIAENYSQPYSTAVCVPDRISSVPDAKYVALPILPNDNQRDLANGNLTYQGHQSMDVAETIKHPDLFYHQLLETPGNTSVYRLRWIELREDLFKGSSIGAAILLPRAEDDSDQDLILCNVAAGWGSSSLKVHSRNGGIGPVDDRIHKGNFSDTTDIPINLTHIPPAQTGKEIDDWFTFEYPVFPQQVINISESWAQYLDPAVRGLNTNLIDILMQQQILPGTEHILAANILPILTVNGLARTSWDSLEQGDVKSVGPNGNDGLDGNYWLSGKGGVFNVDPAESKDWVTFRVQSTLQGYAYNTLTVPPRIAIAILTAYCLLVIGHTLYSGIAGISSNCWDTIAEVTALAMNSTPTAALRNTCAGITELHIFKLPVRILVSKDVEGEGEHLELVFGRVDDGKMEERTIKANRTYGTLPRGVMVEGKKDV